MKWRQYAKYKSSSIEWLGEIPEHWEVTTFKRVGSFQAGTGFPDDEQGLANEELPFYKVSDTNLEDNKVLMVAHNNSVSRDTATRLRAFIFPPGTIVFAKVGAALLLNKRRILVREACIDNNMMGFMPNSCDGKWAYYLMCELDLGELANPGAVPSVNEGQLREVPVPLPPEDEQSAIAAFLDRETARIDVLIKKKERQIELLQEKRTALISHAVTKGLDPNVKMKNSGIEWLGDIPEHWETLQCKFGFSIQLGKMLQNEPQTLNDEQVPYLKALHVQWENVDVSYLPEMWASPEDIRKYSVREGDLLVCEGGEVGRAGILQNPPPKCIIQNALHRVRPKDDNSNRFLMYLLEVASYRGWFDILCNKATIAHFTGEKFGWLSIALPPSNEQRSIATFLDRETARIDALIEKIRRSIDLLREYRTALITAAVTGKIDVRLAAAENTAQAGEEAA